MENIEDPAAWSVDCLTPLAEKACGINPFYHDDFEAVKLEIEKISHGNYPFVIEQCKKLLTHTTKDLRVAGYLCLALTWKYHIQGLIAGLYLYQNLLINFSKDIHPCNENARIAALKWLNNTRFTAILTSTEGMNQALGPKLRQSISDLNASIETHLGKSFHKFTVLDDFLSKLLPQQTKPNEMEIIEEKPQQPSLAAQHNPVNEKQAIGLQRQLIHYWQQEKQWLLACQLARSLRWTNLSIPGKALPEPRKEALKGLETALSQKNPENIIQQCESLFLEPGGQFLLDLQYHAWQAAKDIGQRELTDYLLQQTLWLVKHHPQLKSSAFSNGMPFAASETIQWLDSQSQTEFEGDRREKSTHDYLNEAKKQTSALDVSSLLMYLQNQKSGTALEALHLLQAKARACQDMQRQDLAMVYYQELLSSMDRQQFALWYPQEAVAMWQEILSFTENKGHISLATEQVKQLVFQLKGRICLTGSSVNR